MLLTFLTGSQGCLLPFCSLPLERLFNHQEYQYVMGVEDKGGPTVLLE